MKPVWVLGAGGHAKVVIDTLRATGAWDVVGLLDDDGARWGTEYLAIPVEGGISDQLIGRFGVEFAIIAIGSNYAACQDCQSADSYNLVGQCHPSDGPPGVRRPAGSRLRILLRDDRPAGCGDR